MNIDPNPVFRKLSVIAVWGLVYIPALAVYRKFIVLVIINLLIV